MEFRHSPSVSPRLLSLLPQSKNCEVPVKIVDSKLALSLCVFVRLDYVLETPPGWIPASCLETTGSKIRPN